LFARQLQVEQLIADGHADAQRIGRALAAKRAIGQVLDGEVAVLGVGRFDPAAQLRVVRGIEHVQTLKLSRRPLQQSA
jgi:hypothetical protein